MGRTFDKKLTKEELAEKIWNACLSYFAKDGYDDIDSIEDWRTHKTVGQSDSFVEKCYIAHLPLTGCLGIYDDPDPIAKKVRSDISKVDFDWENFEYRPRDAYCETASLVGFRTLSNGLTYLGICAGGDWEFPVFLIVYWDGKQLRGYVPKDGNPWNTTTKKAYGNDYSGDGNSDYLNMKKRYPEWAEEYGDGIEEGDELWEGDEYIFNQDHLQFEAQKIIEDVLSRIQYSGVEDEEDEAPWLVDPKTQEVIQKTRDEIVDKVWTPLHDSQVYDDPYKLHVLIDKAMTELTYILWAEENDVKMKKDDSVFYAIAKNNVED